VVRAAAATPVIGISGPDAGGTAAWLCAALAVWRAGGKPRRITPLRPRAVSELDGLIIGGGADVDPALYGEEASSVEELRRASRNFWRFLVSLTLAPIIYLLRRVLSTGMHVRGDLERDRLETALIKGALERGLPILGICRGAQLLNVHCGGSLYQDLSDFYEESPQAHSIWPYKRIVLEPASRLAGIIGGGSTCVNSLHRQAVNEIAPGFAAVARESNAVVQAIEHRERPFVIGVQWHPEYLPQREEQRRIFQALVAAARAQ
jgi:putative glutamine amidotransferase